MTGKKRDLEKTKPAPPEAAPLLLEDLRRMIEETRRGAAATVNAALTLLYWRIGRRINEEILQGERAEYGKEIVVSLARQLEVDYGRGFSEKSLRHMLRFAEAFPDERIVSALMRQLSWTHFLSIIYLQDSLQRDFYAEMCRIERWSTRTLQSKIGSLLYERTALSKKPEELARLELAALRDEDKLTPDLVFRDPYFLDFLGLTGAFQERDLEAAILREMEAFILELGAGFTFAARQKRITLDGDDFYLDLLFFHRYLRRLIAIELKLDKFRPEHKGQMELYLRWLDKYERHEEEHAPIGMILCVDKKQEQIEILELGASGIHVAEYLVELPPRKLLADKLHRAVELARMRLDGKIEGKE
ncbi:MAG: PDDEXK nuclease domain-containing protein [Syntrophobacteraceae bacterium]|jgi:predicted nuclease of restriction endonuclease-like (RecB) superfamily